MSNLNLPALVNKLNPICQQALEAAAGMCFSKGYFTVEIEHWLIKLIETKNNDLFYIFKHSDINQDYLLLELQTNLQYFKTGNTRSPVLSKQLIDLIREALIIGLVEFEDIEIRTAYIIFALLSSESSFYISNELTNVLAKINISHLNESILSLMAKSIEQKAAENVTTKDTIKAHTKTSALDKFTINLIEQARDGKIDKVIGRDAEIRQVMDILMRRRQNNPILTGEPGVGKTAIVEGLALRIAEGDIPDMLKNTVILSLDLTLLQAGAGIRGEFEKRIQSIIQEIKQSSQPVILFIDEAHTLIGAGGAQVGQADAANALKPALARGELRTIAATTWSEYKKYFEQDAALARRFQVVKVEEPSIAIATAIVRGLVPSLEAYHGVRILDEAVSAVVTLSQRYLPERQLPDKAISVLDTACAGLAMQAVIQPLSIENYQHRLEDIERQINLIEREQTYKSKFSEQLINLKKERKHYKTLLDTDKDKWQQGKDLIQAIHHLRSQLENKYSSKYNNKKLSVNCKQLRLSLQQHYKKLQKLQSEQVLLHDCIDKKSIANVIANWTGIPLGRMINDETQILLNLQTRLQKRIIGQDHALKLIAQSLQTSRAQLKDPHKPIGVFLLVGPSGVGKTQTALALAEEIYSNERNLTAINLAEFKEEHKVSLLLGSPPGYIGYGEGGLLTEAVRRKPYSLVLLDEVEKAHPGLQDIFYQVFDKGVLRDGQGRDVDFRNTLIILTSNVASELITRICVDQETMPDTNLLLNKIKPELQKFFKPAFLGRVTVIPYLALDKTSLNKIIHLHLKRIENRFAEHHQVKFTYDNSLIRYIEDNVKTTNTGARAVESLINQSLLPDLSKFMLNALIKNSKIKELCVLVNEVGEFAYTSRV